MAGESLPSMIPIVLLEMYKRMHTKLLSHDDDMCSFGTTYDSDSLLFISYRWRNKNEDENTKVKYERMQSHALYAVLDGKIDRRYKCTDYSMTVCRKDAQ